jgi:prepilin-type N-terminal cleavage/methylation domain-containing protein
MTKSLVRKLKSGSGFSLLEVAIVLLIVTILLAAIAIPLASQVQIRRAEETRKLLEESKEALLGFIVANGRFPCPAAPNATGVESFCVEPSGASCTPTAALQTHGNCSNFYNGLLPSSTLGLSSLDEQGYLRDGWGLEKNRIRYAVLNVTIGPIPHSLTAQDGMRQATVDLLGDTNRNYLFICTSGSGVTGSTCGAAPQLTSKAPALVFSLGENAVTGGIGVDESKNLDDNTVFVSHTPIANGANVFDDILTWMPMTVVLNKMLSAGKMP